MNGTATLSLVPFLYCVFHSLCVFFFSRRSLATRRQRQGGELQAKVRESGTLERTMHLVMVVCEQAVHLTTVLMMIAALARLTVTSASISSVCLCVSLGAWSIHRESDECIKRVPVHFAAKGEKETEQKIAHSGSIKSVVLRSLAGLMVFSHAQRVYLRNTLPAGLTT